MRLTRTLLALAFIFAASLPAHAYMHARRGPTSPGLFKKRSASRPVKSPGHQFGPRAMDSGRAAQIQAALIKSGYLSGSPSGRWDAESEAAMQKLQGNNGWQTKLTPDSRALILLGLGPKQEGSAETAKTAAPWTEQSGSSLATGENAQE